MRAGPTPSDPEGSSGKHCDRVPELPEARASLRSDLINKWESTPPWLIKNLHTSSPR